MILKNNMLIKRRDSPTVWKIMQLIPGQGIKLQSVKKYNSKYHYLLLDPKVYKNQWEVVTKCK